MHNIAYVNEQGAVGVCCDPRLAEAYRQEYTTMPLPLRELPLVLAGFCPRPLLVATQVRRMFREQERAA